jgi:hypothetical protein
MGHAALLLAGLGLLLGLWPLFAQGLSGFVLAVAGLLPSLGGLVLSLRARSRALRDGQKLALATAALGLSVGAACLASSWLLVLAFFLLRRR